MTLDTDWKLIFVSMLGALLSELIRAKKALDDGAQWTASSNLSLAISLVLGSVAVLLKPPETVLLALTAGFTAPATITGLLGNRGAAVNFRSGSPSLRGWWSY